VAVLAATIVAELSTDTPKETPGPNSCTARICQPRV
jgi:hypothetical protein